MTPGGLMPLARLANDAPVVHVVEGADGVPLEIRVHLPNGTLDSTLANPHPHSHPDPNPNPNPNPSPDPNPNPTPSPNQVSRAPCLRASTRAPRPPHRGSPRPAAAALYLQSACTQATAFEPYT
eukprot:scaffold65274_cov30-Phaeocystis_antarctica.AAC.1